MSLDGLFSTLGGPQVNPLAWQDAANNQTNQLLERMKLGVVTPQERIATGDRGLGYAQLGEQQRQFDRKDSLATNAFNQASGLLGNIFSGQNPLMGQIFGGGQSGGGMLPGMGSAGGGTVGGGGQMPAIPQLASYTPYQAVSPTNGQIPAWQMILDALQPRVGG